MSFAGKLLYHAWHRPAGVARQVIAAGGPLQVWRTVRGRREMEAATHRLPALHGLAGPPVTMHLLTGRRFWYQTAFCLWTFSKCSRRRVAPVIHDDGTLGDLHRGTLRRLFPESTFVSIIEAKERLDRHLPATKFPVLRERWVNYPNLRKLTDPHLGSTGWQLVVDSDLLFFREPEFLVSWCDAPDRPLHAVDCATAYGYPVPLMAELAGAPVADLVNVGLTGLRSETLDWEKLEAWTAALLARHGTHYFLEQALVAMLVAGRECAVAPAADYVTGPREPEASACRSVMHHYVADSKRWYFRANWRRSLDSHETHPGR
ncbi:MAG: glycosyl transferase [Opitutus sp.]|nr:glycosyl transferase [Opitutus sp.]